LTQGTRKLFQIFIGKNALSIVLLIIDFGRDLSILKLVREILRQTNKEID